MNYNELYYKFYLFYKNYIMKVFSYSEEKKKIF
jgi:hypothetical protein